MGLAPARPNNIYTEECIELSSVGLAPARPNYVFSSVHGPSPESRVQGLHTLVACIVHYIHDCANLLIWVLTITIKGVEASQRNFNY